jgi:hypothetical protein
MRPAGEFFPATCPPDLTTGASVEFLGRQGGIGRPAPPDGMRMPTD